MKTTLHSLRYFTIALFLIFAAGVGNAQTALSTSANGNAFLFGTFGGTLVTYQLTLSSSPNNVVPFQITGLPSWLTANITSGTTPSAITFAANPADRSITGPGVYSASVFFSSPGVTSAGVAFYFTVNAATPLVSNPNALNFGYVAGGQLPGAQSLSITASSPIPYQVTADKPWITLGAASASGLTPGSVTVGVDPSQLTPSPAAFYQGSVKITPTNGFPALIVPIFFYYSGSPQLNLSVSSLTFNYQIGAANNIVQKSFNLASAGSLINFFASASITNPANVQQWLGVAPTQGATPATVTVSVNPAGLPSGQYQGIVTISAPGASNSTQTVQVTLNVSALPLLDLSTNSLSFSYQVGGALPADQFVTPNGTTPGMNYFVAVSTNNTGTWLNATASGLTPAPIDVNVNPAGLPPATYNGTITLNAQNGGNNPQVINVTLTVAIVPTLIATPNALNFNYEIGFNVPGSQTVSVTSNSGSLGFSVSANQNNTSNAVSWLLLGSQSSTATPGAFTVGVSPAGMAAGQYTGTIALATPGNANPLQVPVTLNVANTGTPLAIVATPSVTFTAQAGSNAPPQVVNVFSTGEAINYTVTAAVTTPAGSGWLTATGGGVASASTPSTFIVGVNSSTLPVGSWKGTITVDPKNGNPVVVVPVTINITLGNISLSSPTLTFQQNAGGLAPQAQNITVTSSGAPLQFTTIVGGVSWLTVSPNAGTTPATLSVLVNANAANLQPGPYSGQITVVSAGAGNSPQTVTVNLTVNPAQTVTLNNATLNFGSQFGTPAPAAQIVALTVSNGTLPFTAAATVTGPVGINWLSVTPTSGTLSTTATPLSISVNPTGLDPGTYKGTVTVTAANASNSPLTINVTYNVTAIPTPVPTDVQNGGGFTPGPIAPGEILTIRGTNMGPATGVVLAANASGFYPTTASSVSVTFDNIPGVLLFVSAVQINVIAPYEIAGRAQVRMVVIYQNTSSVAIVLNVVASNPGIFNTASGQASVYNDDNSINTPANPTLKGHAIQIFGTGEGQTNLPGVDGLVIAPLLSAIKKPLLPVSVSIGGVPVPPENIFYFGSVPGAVSGAFQVNLFVPDNAPSGPAQVVLTVGAASSTGPASISIQ